MLNALLTTSLMAENNDEFIIKFEPKQNNKKLSKNALKENIGEATQQAFDCSLSLGRSLGAFQIDLANLQTSINSVESSKKLQELIHVSGKVNQETGKLQLALASMQRQFSKIIEKLIENRRPFKKAKTPELNEALSALQQSHRQITCEIAECNKLQNFIKKADKNNLTASTKTAEQAANSLHQIVCNLKQVEQKLNSINCLKVS
jgi:hypothetical protein